jgi:hypothetical protein
MGFSSICIEPDWRGRKLSRPLMAAAADTARKQGAELAYMMARRAVDRYYPRFDFHGMVAYPEFAVAVADLTSGSSVVRPAGINDLLHCERWYRDDHLDVFGRVERSPAYWAFQIERCRINGANLFIVERDGVAEGYILATGSLILEAAFSPSADCRAGLAAFATAVGATSRLTMAMAPEQMTARRLVAAGCDVVLSRRCCTYGGHMVRILDVARVAAALERRVAIRAAAYGLPPLTEYADTLTLRWDGRRAHVELAATEGSFGLEASRALLGADLLRPTASLLDPPRSLHFSAPDHV